MKRLLAVLLLLSSASCATYQAVTSAPPEFWGTAEKIVLGLFSDVKSIIAFFL